ncbi:S1 RNA-binding domain-containing protein [Lentzea waywayandensis]|uniref:S1 RNA-binding domain-containing protein n=1 Tax=Lentzea waywayandensis TaxID=84724 RepID=UPI001C42EB4A|nr:S1 RNA-binding domain-containing protein [Lentzea waywayandensis]
MSPHERWLEMVREYPDLHAFLSGPRSGDVLSGTVAAVERFGVFVRLDDGPAHPFFPGVGFVTIPDLTWHHIDDMSEVVSAGQRVTGEFLDYDTWNMEARLSLKALQPDPFQEFADAVTAGHELRGLVTKAVPFGVFVRVADGVEGFLHEDEFGAAPPREGDELHVVVADVDRERRRVNLTSGRG